MTAAQFLAHCDYFDKPEHDSNHHARGGRTWTFMVYLTAVEEGGETEFTKLGITFRPEPGMALVWCNLDAHGKQNPLTEHRAHPDSHSACANSKVPVCATHILCVVTVKSCVYLIQVPCSTHACTVRSHVKICVATQTLNECAVCVGACSV